MGGARDEHVGFNRLDLCVLFMPDSVKIADERSGSIPHAMSLFEVFSYRIAMELCKYYPSF